MGIEINETLEQENLRLKSALQLICILQSKKKTHLGRPRSSDLKCIFCIAYLSANYGAYEYLTREKLENAIKEHLDAKQSA